MVPIDTHIAARFILKATNLVSPPRYRLSKPGADLRDYQPKTNKQWQRGLQMNILAPDLYARPLYTAEHTIWMTVQSSWVAPSVIPGSL